MNICSALFICQTFFLLTTHPPYFKIKESIQKTHGGIQMYHFSNDYSEGAHPRILEALMKKNLEQNVGYGLDSHCFHAAELIKKECKKEELDVHFLCGGTQTNATVIAHVLRPYEAVISADTGHINGHETGAVEASGHKIISIFCEDGKLTPSAIKDVLNSHQAEHDVQPKMVYISNTTELGTQYTKEELEALSSFCHQNHLYLFLDGARLASALTSSINDLTLKDLARLTDLFYIGGTKNGILFGEALVICCPHLKENFRYMMKQHGAMMAKGWLLGLQFEVLFENGLFYELAKHANHTASLLRMGLEEHNVSFLTSSFSNQLFPILPNQIVAQLEEKYSFNIERELEHDTKAIRLVTSWATPETAVLEFLEDLKAL